MSTNHSTFRRRMLALANGGHVRGPGSGTSDSIPARLSDGEFVLPTDTVRKVGVRRLQDLVDMTHTPSGKPPHPAQFADGGLVDEERSIRNLNSGLRGGTGGGAGGSAVPALGDPPTKAALVVGAPTSADELPLGRRHSAGGRTGGQILASGLDSAARAFFDSFQKQPESASAAGMPAVRTDVQRGGGNVRANLPPMKPQPAITYTPPPRPAPAAAAPFDFDKFQPQPGEGAFRNEQTGEVTRLQDGRAPRGMRTWKAPAVVPRSDAPPNERQDVRAPVLNPNGGLFAAMIDLAHQKASAVDAIAANKGMRNDRRDDLNELRTNADIAATAGRLALDGQRAGLEGQRVGLDAQRVAQGDAAARLASDEFGLRREAAGFQTRVAQRMENAQVALENASTPAEQRSARERLLALAGKQAQNEHKLYVTPTTKNLDGSTTVGSVYRLNSTTGDVTRVDGGQAAAPALPSSKDAMVKGQVYQTARGPARWDGGQFQLVR